MGGVRERRESKYLDVACRLPSWDRSPCRQVPMLRAPPSWPHPSHQGGPPSQGDEGRGAASQEGAEVGGPVGGRGVYAHASTPSSALTPALGPGCIPLLNFNKSLNSLGWEHPSALHSRLRSWGPVSRCASWKQDKAIPAQRGRLCLRSGSPGSPSVKDEVPAPWHQSFAKKQMLGDGMGCAFGSVC